MVYSSPVKRSALGSISSILNTPAKTPIKNGRVGKSASPQKSGGIRQRIANLFSKENTTPQKRRLVQWNERKPKSRGEMPPPKKTIYHLVPMSDGSLPLSVSSSRISLMHDVETEGRQVESTVHDVLFTSTINNNRRTATPPPQISPEIRQIAALLKSRLSLAAYKIKTNQIQTPFNDLTSLPIETDTSISLAIQRFRESKHRQDQANFFRKHRLSTICRRESRRTRLEKLTSPLPHIAPESHLPLNRPVASHPYPSTIMEVSSESEERGLPSPPVSQKSNILSNEEGPSTPAPKKKIRRARKMKTYDEFTGHLGLSSPPQQVYDPRDGENEWSVDDVVGDVPSSVMRGVEGLWALAK